jgi:hypothetical protein
MLKILVDGKESRLYTDSGRQFVSPNDHTIEVIWEFDKELQKDLGEGAQIHHRFTTEGVIVTAQDNDREFDISSGTWDELAADAGMI